jgi:transposase
MMPRDKTNAARKRVMDLYRQGLCVTEIAGVLGISRNTVSARKSEAMRLERGPKPPTHRKPRQVIECSLCGKPFQGGDSRRNAERCCWRKKRAMRRVTTEIIISINREEEKLMRDLERMRTDPSYYGVQGLGSSSPLREVA